MTETTRPTDPAPGAFAARYGLVRPLQGRYLAGACAALGRATRTDPVLWRVLLPVLTCFSGVGAAIYLGLWLGTPEEGDTASPLEGVLGRGHSSMSSPLVAVLGGLAGVILAFALFQPFGLVLLAATGLSAGILLVQRNPVPPTTTAPPGPVPPPTTVAPAAVPDPTVAAPTATAPTVTTPTGETVPGAPPAPGGYRPAFAPHGPFAVVPAALPIALPVRTRRERSALTSVTCLGTLMVLGLVGLIDLTGAASVSATGYVAAALATVGLGLIVGTWLGRGRGLIAIGTVLALALPVAHAATEWDKPEYFATAAAWEPAGPAAIAEEYRLMFGDGTLDLRQVDFGGRTVEVRAEVSFGDLRIYLPPEVDLHADLRVRMGEANVLGERVSGNGGRTVELPGSAEDGGSLRLDLDVRFANLEVYR